MTALIYTTKEAHVQLLHGVQVVVQSLHGCHVNGGREYPLKRCSTTLCKCRRETHCCMSYDRLCAELPGRIALRNYSNSVRVRGDLLSVIRAC